MADEPVIDDAGSSARYRLVLVCMIAAMLVAAAYFLTRPRYSRSQSPFGNCDLIHEVVTYGKKSLVALWISRPGDTDEARWQQIGHQVSIGWTVDWCGPRHVVLTRLGEPHSTDRHRVVKFGDIEVLELSFGGLKAVVSPGSKHTLYTWNGWGARATAILSTVGDSIRLLSLPESARVEGRWLDEHRLQLDVSTTESLDGLPSKWQGIDIEVR